MVGIVILNFNNSRRTLDCVKSLREHCPESLWKLCIVDNASRHEEYAILEEAFRGEAGISLLRSDENGGYACGNNLGLKYFEDDTDIDVLLVLNDDTLFTMDILSPMRDYLLSHEQCGVVCPLVLCPDGSIDHACARRQKSTRDLALQATSLGKIGVKRSEFIPLEGLRDLPEVHTQVPPGSCMMLRKEVFKQAGYLDPHTFLYFEEHILCERLRRLGLGCVLLPQIEIIHIGGATTARQPSKAIYRHWRNSYLYFMKEYSTVPKPLQWLLKLRTGIKAL